MIAPRPLGRGLKLGPVLAAAAAVGTLFLLLVPSWHAAVPGRQLGPRGTSMIAWAPVVDPTVSLDKPPIVHTPQDYGVDPAALTDPRPATEVYHNLKVSAGLSAGEFMQLQLAITDWVAPRTGCAFCHVGEDFADDGKPQKQTARTMIDMTRTVNADWRNHVGQDGVTCYTCHRGQGVPPKAWALDPAKLPPPFVAKQEDWHEAATTVHDFFPTAALAEYLLQATPAKGAAYTAWHGDPTPATVEVKRLYEVMMQMSDDIGVNCGFCHNSRAFSDWSQSTPERWVGLSGIQLTRALNNDFLLPLGKAMPQRQALQNGGNLPTTPAAEVGMQNGNLLANCGTCHYQVPHPLQGLNLLSRTPWLGRTAP